MTQTQRLIEFLETHPLASSLEITLACDIVNVTRRAYRSAASAGLTGVRGTS